MESLMDPVNILLVDDRPDGLFTLETVLKNPAYHLVRASSGYEALAKLNEYEFAVILLDVQMPAMDGFETANFIKRREKTRHVPIIFITAISTEERYVAQGYESGGVDYVFKPFEPTILRSKVAVFVELYRKNKQVVAQAEQLRESERRERAQYLAHLELESLRRYQNLADAIPHIVWKAEADGTLSYFNRMWMEYTGLTLDQSTGAGWKSAFHPEDLPHFIEAWSKVKNSQTPFETEARIRRKDGAYQWYFVRGLPSFNEEGVLVEWLGTCTEIQARKENEMALQEAKIQAEAANKAKSLFLANMSHEIRTPLAAIMGFAELLLRHPNNDGEQRSMYLATIHRNGKQLLHIID